MVSRLPSFLHPVAGRPLIWHTVNSLLALEPAPEQVVVLTPPDVAVDFFDDLAPRIENRTFVFGAGGDTEPLDLPDTRILLVHGSACLEPGPLRHLLDGGEGGWIATAEAEGEAVAAMVDSPGAAELLHLAQPFSTSSGMLTPEQRLEDAAGVFVVRTRADLARAHRRVRDQLLKALMDAGATFLLPETVTVDVDVRIGRDSVVYPGVTLEGQTTIGEETVVGPGCRIIDSWIGSGVELKGWNYVAHTSVRNRAILEPYVRRGFD